MRITHTDDDEESITLEVEAWEEEVTGERSATITLEDEISIELSPKEVRDLVTELQKMLAAFEESDKARVQAWNALSA